STAAAPSAVRVLSLSIGPPGRGRRDSRTPSAGEDRSQVCYGRLDRAAGPWSTTMGGEARQGGAAGRTPPRRRDGTASGPRTSSAGVLLVNHERSQSDRSPI